MPLTVMKKVKPKIAIEIRRRGIAYSVENERTELPTVPNIDRIVTFIDKQPHAPAPAPIIEPAKPGLIFLELDRRIFTR